MRRRAPRLVPLRPGAVETRPRPARAPRAPHPVRARAAPRSRARVIACAIARELRTCATASHERCASRSSARRCWSTASRARSCAFSPATSACSTPSWRTSATHAAIARAIDGSSSPAPSSACFCWHTSIVACSSSSDAPRSGDARHGLDDLGLLDGGRRRRRQVRRGGRRAHGARRRARARSARARAQAPAPEAARRRGGGLRRALFGHLAELEPAVLLGRRRRRGSVELRRLRAGMVWRRLKKLEAPQREGAQA